MVNISVDPTNIEPCLLPLVQLEVSKWANMYLGHKRTLALTTHIQSEVDEIAETFRNRPPIHIELQHATYILLQKLGVCK